MISIPAPIKDITVLEEDALTKEELLRQVKLAGLLTFVEGSAILRKVAATWEHDLENGLLEAWDIPGGMIVVGVKEAGGDRVLDINFFMGDLRSLLWARRYLRSMAKDKGCKMIVFETDNIRLASLADKVRLTGYWSVE